MVEGVVARGESVEVISDHDPLGSPLLNGLHLAKVLLVALK
jgi:uncharacterized protein (DUF2249 family)